MGKFKAVSAGEGETPGFFNSIFAGFNDFQIEIIFFVIILCAITPIYYVGNFKDIWW
jgi:hypothetical protein